MSLPISSTNNIIASQNTDITSKKSENVAKVDSNKAEGIEEYLKSDKGDELSISNDAKSLSKHRLDFAEKNDGKYELTSFITDDAEFKTIASAKTDSGRNIVVEQIMQHTKALVKNGEGGSDMVAYGFRASVYDADGKLEYNFMLQRDTIINENEDGSLNISDYFTGDETDGDDFIIGKSGSHLAGGAGDDTFVVVANESYSGVESMGRGYSNSKDTSVEGGDGDDNIAIASTNIYAKVNVDSGAGNDTISASGYVHDSVISTGDGNDTIDIQGVQDSTITTGEGDDVVDLNGGANSYSNIDTGAGDDSLTASGGIVGGKVNTGDGNDVIEVRSLLTNLNTGEGNDVVRASNVSGVINTGDGNDSITVDGDVFLSKIDMGDGNNTFKARSFLSSRLTTGTGYDSVIFTGSVKQSYINTGKGDDYVQIAKDLIESFLDTGKGDDEVNILGDVKNSKVYGGAGDDKFRVDGNIIGSSIDSEVGEEFATTEGDEKKEK
ncbi:calcium-binding protein [Maridesulfovibrio zosterae]|uniref:calcium-binding protein n=1 Tax=Maridesulfovibrio zosterae TaxID=82171 RepID=UPI00040721C2|nr:calcium-binding protein [Maridesulfovibrio zosterae]